MRLIWSSDLLMVLLHELINLAQVQSMLGKRPQKNPWRVIPQKYI